MPFLLEAVFCGTYLPTQLCQSRFFLCLKTTKVMKIALQLHKSTNLACFGKPANNVMTIS